jgi:hypothetical protein
MDTKRFRRSENVEDSRLSKTMEIVNLLTAPMQASYYDLKNHPFEKPYSHYERLYLKNNPLIDPSQYSQMAIDAGIRDVPMGTLAAQDKYEVP